MPLDILPHQIDLVEGPLNRGRPERPAGYEDGEKLGVETAFTHPGNVDVALRITFAKIERAGKQPLRSVGMSVKNDGREVKFTRARGNVIRRSATSKEEPAT